MRFTVVWLPAAEDQLAEIWLNASARDAVTLASNRVEVLLRNDPEKSVTIWVGQYALRVDPLAVLCEIDSGDRMVRIIEVIRTDS